MGYLKLYTRIPEGEEYPSATAYSVHMAYSCDGVDYEPLNQNYGMLFTEGTIREDNTIEEKGIKYPRAVKRKDGGYGFFAVRVNADGAEDETAVGMYPYWITEDMVHFHDKGLVSPEDIANDCGCSMDDINNILSHIRDSKEYTTEITDTDAKTLCAVWTPIHNTGVEPCNNAVISSKEELDKIQVKLEYSDGSSCMKNVEWDDSAIDYSKPGTYTVKGRISQPVYKFPLAEGYADPVVFRYADKWYFIATNDNNDDVGLFVRYADTVAGLFDKDVKEYCILDYDEDRELIQTFWAPEFHMIGDDLYILFAVGPKNWGPQSHMMKLKSGGRIECREDWEDPVKVIRTDGTPLAKSGITLDMTYIKVRGRSYLIWSERYHIGTPLDSGSMIYIAEINEDKPYVIISEPVLLTRPLYGWENQYGTINNEGPYPLVVGNKVYIAYSGGSAGGYSYVVGLLSIDDDKELLCAEEWDKAICPLLSAYSVEGEYGPGHNSFYRDENGDVWIAYHAKITTGFVTRSTAIRRVHFNVYGEPVFNMSADRDIAPEYKNVSMTVDYRM